MQGGSRRRSALQRFRPTHDWSCSGHKSAGRYHHLSVMSVALYREHLSGPFMLLVRAESGCDARLIAGLSSGYPHILESQLFLDQARLAFRFSGGGKAGNMHAPVLLSIYDHRI